MIRLLFVVESLSGGGAEKVLATLVEHLDRSRFHVTVAPLVDTGVWVGHVRQHADRYVPLIRPAGVSLLSRLRYWLQYHLIYKWLPPRLVCRLLPSDCDVEIAFCEGFVTRLVAHSPRNRRRVAWVHADLSADHWTRSVFPTDEAETHAYNRYDRVVVVSDYARNSFTQALPDVTTPVSTLYNPLDDGFIRRAASYATALPPKRKGALRLISVGRLEPVKGLDRLLRAVATLRAEHLDVELWLLGEGSLRGEFERLIIDNKLDEVVTLWGFRPNPYAYLAASDVFVCSSVSEGYSLAIAEAMIVGLPVVSTRCAGPDELLAGGGRGLLVDNTEAALTDALRRVATGQLTLPEPAPTPFTLAPAMRAIEDALTFS